MESLAVEEERYLFACKHCYLLEPRVIVEISNIDVYGECECCAGEERLFLHETVTRSKNGVVFHEYQDIRPRKSRGQGNKYCWYRGHCHRGSDCWFVHTCEEMTVWTAESEGGISRQMWAMIFDNRSTLSIDKIFHCPFCALNFDDNQSYVSHLNTGFHKKMRRHFEKREDTGWSYQLNMSQEPSVPVESDSATESVVESGAEHRERLKRAAVYRARNEFVREEISLEAILKERIRDGDVQEIEHVDMEQVKNNGTETIWECCLQLTDHEKSTWKRSWIFGESFKMKRTDTEIYVAQLDASPVIGNDFMFHVRFQNLDVDNEYNGKLFFDFGEEISLSVINFDVNNRFCSRIIIDYPAPASHESAYEENLKRLEIQYESPKKETLSQVYLKHLTSNSYLQNMHNFLYQEEFARRNALSGLNLKSEVTISQHIFMPSGTVLGDRGRGSLYGEFENPVRLSVDSDEGFLARQSCNSVLVGMRGKSLAYECSIEAWSNMTVYIHIPKRCVEDLNLEHSSKIPLMIQYKLDRIKFCRMHHSLDCLEERLKLICPDPLAYASLSEHPGTLEILDESQNSVLKQVLGSKIEDRRNPNRNCYPPLLIAGPFGTGKTHTIRNTIQQILEDEDNDSRILLCTHSNSAADLYIQDMVKGDWDRTKFKVLRVMYHQRKPNTVLISDIHDFCLYTNDGCSFRYPTMDEVLRYNIIITTFSTCPALGQLGVGLRSGAFTHIFLDEASQAMEPEVIMPLTLADAGNTRVIIAGDHKQINERTFLPKEVPIPTFLERLYVAYGDFPSLNSQRILLCNNYRCVDGLLQLISELFYRRGILQCSGDVQLLDGYGPVHFTHVEGECTSTSLGDYTNIQEAKQVVEEVSVLTESRLSQDEILVTSPYFSQVKLIRDLLRRKGFRGVIVYRAANVQALQYKAVILSCVMRKTVSLKADGDRSGFLCDENLLNTVLTRAKSLVIAIGDAATLCAVGECSRKWRAFIQHCEASGTINPDHVTTEWINRQTLQPNAREFTPGANGRYFQREEIDLSRPCSDNQSDGSDDEDLNDDIILYDMLNKSSGAVSDDSIQYEECYVSERKDPNEPDIVSNRLANRRQLTPKHSLGELDDMLASEPHKYLRCRIHIESRDLAQASPIDVSGASISDSGGSIILDGKEKMGRAFQNDEVLVRIEGDHRLIYSPQSAEAKRKGQVMGIFKRGRNLQKCYFLCRPFHNDISIMVPTERPPIFFKIHCPKNHRRKDPDKIPVFQIRQQYQSHVDLELVSCDKVRKDCLYAVRYMMWSEYCQSPLGYVEKVLTTDGLALENRLNATYGVSDTILESVMVQVRSVKEPVEKLGDDVVEIFTIDAENARVLDDGLSLKICEQHLNCYLMGIHVTDVASHFLQDTPIDTFAKHNVCSIDQRHMLPEFLPEKLSLDVNKLRKTISLFFHSTVNPRHVKGNNPFVTPRKALVRSQQRLTYLEAEDILIADFNQDDQASVKYQLKKIWEILWSWRVHRLDCAAYNQDFASYSEFAVQGMAQMLVEEAMVAYNANMAEYLVRHKNFDIAVRAQPLPEKKKWATWRKCYPRAISQSPYLASTDEFIDTKRQEMNRFYRLEEDRNSSEGSDENVAQSGADIELYASVWDDIRRHIENRNYRKILMILAQDVLRPLQVPAWHELKSISEKAEWVSGLQQDTLHSSLRLILYTKCTSPLRRYSDIIIQRCIIRALDNSALPGREWESGLINDQIETMIADIEVDQFAKTLKDEPVTDVVTVCVLTDGGIQFSSWSRLGCLPSKFAEIDYGHLMLDFQTKDILEGFPDDMEEERRNEKDDIIVRRIDVAWKFRFYDYQEYLSETNAEESLQGIDCSQTVKIANADWQRIVELMMETEEINGQEVMEAIRGLNPTKHRRAYHDRRCGETRNKPLKIFHHRAIKKTLQSGIPIEIQLTSYESWQCSFEPFVQLYILTQDLSVCVHHNKEPILAFAADANKMNDDHHSLEDYERNLRPLINMDGAYNAVTDGSSIILNGIKILRTKSGGHKFLLKREFCRDRYLDIHVGDLVCLRLSGVKNKKASSDGKTYTVVCHGRVTSVFNKENDKPHIAVCFKIFPQSSRNDDFEDNVGKLWNIELLKLGYMHRQLHISLRELPGTTNELVKNIVLCQEIDDADCELPNSCKDLRRARTLNGFPYTLNDQQYTQKNKCLTQKFTLVQGPPGTGKSYLGAHIAASFVKINRARNPKTPEKVLYCGPSNKAVDVAAGFLKNAEGIKVVRMYSVSLEEKIYPNPIRPPTTNQIPGEELKNPDDNLNDIALHEIIRNAYSQWGHEIREFDRRVKDKGERFTREEVDKYQENVKSAKEKALNEADIIVCTCSLSAQLKELKDSINFGQCIIDECGMCSEPETLIPILTSSPKQVVLIGDHKQLKPVIKCRKAELLGLGKSLFKRYSHMAEMLTVQYRMNRDIMNVPSKLFYDDKLVADSSIDRRSNVNYFPHVDSNNIFWHVVGKENQQKFSSMRGGRKSKYNMEEVEKVEQLLEYLLEDTDLEQKDIMVLSPYTAQCTRIRQRILENPDLPDDIHVGSVVTSQGSQAKFVILSTVRSLDVCDIKDNPSPMWRRLHLGFVTDAHQVNVALTRAQLGLCIIGNKNLLETSELWDEIIESYDRRNALYKEPSIKGRSLSNHYDCDYHYLELDDEYSDLSDDFFNFDLELTYSDSFDDS